MSENCCTNDQREGEQNEKATKEEVADINQKEVCALKSQGLSEVPPFLLAGGLQFDRLHLDYNDIEELPLSLPGVFRHLSILSMVGNCLTSLPPSIGELGALEELYVGENMLKSLPPSICGLKSLKSLDLISNEIRYLPHDIGSLQNLMTFVCTENQFSCLPDSFNELRQLQSFSCDSNILHCLPDEFGQLKSLEILNLSNNQIDNLPPSFGCLSGLVSVDLSDNPLTLLPSECNSLQLKKFFLDQTCLRCLPPWVGDLDHLEELSLRDVKLKSLPNSFGRQSHSLKYVDLAGNFLEDFPECFPRLRRLEFLHMGSVDPEIERCAGCLKGNWLTKLPDNFGDLRSLTVLRLDENQLKELPDSIGNLVHLEKLDLGQNVLQCLPDTICNFSCLHSLWLTKNCIEYLPKDFGNLQNLTELRCDSNLLTKLPDSFKKLMGLVILDLFDNRLEDPPDFLNTFQHLRKFDLSGNVFDVNLIKSGSNKLKYSSRVPRDSADWRGKFPHKPGGYDCQFCGDYNPECAHCDSHASRFDTTMADESAYLWKTHSAEDTVSRSTYNRDPFQSRERDVQVFLSPSRRSFSPAPQASAENMDRPLAVGEQEEEYWDDEDDKEEDKEEEEYWDEEECWDAQKPQACGEGDWLRQELEEECWDTTDSLTGYDSSFTAVLKSDHPHHDASSHRPSKPGPCAWSSQTRESSYVQRALLLIRKAAELPTVAGQFSDAEDSEDTAI